jgi:hypothetical protein
MKNNIIIAAATGSGAISTTFAPSRAFVLYGFTLRYSSNPVTSENLVLTLDAKDGTAYDTILYSMDPSASAARDILWQPEGGPLPFENGDGVKITFTNTDARTYALRIIAELL